MTRHSSTRQLRLITELSVTPLLDLALVLLLVFMVTAPLLENDASLLLPVSASPARDVPPRDVVTLAVDAAQALTLDGGQVARGGLVAALQRLRETRPEVAVLVQMHHALPVEALVAIMDDLTNAGVTKTSVVAARPAAP